jgi:hypothetical protein
MATATAPATPVRKKTSATTLRLVRKTHLYLGLFISPALLFFAFTGAVQMLSLHEAGGRSYNPPAVLAELGQIHKHAGIATPVPDASAKADKAGPISKSPKLEATLASKQRQHLPMKIFFVLVAVGLLTSTATGIYMSYKYERNRLLVTGTLAAGIAIPLLLLKF